MRLASKVLDGTISGMVVAFAACLLTYAGAFPMLFPPLGTGPWKSSVAESPPVTADRDAGGAVRRAGSGVALGRASSMVGHLDVGRAYVFEGRKIVVVSGWAMDTAAPSRPVTIVVFRNGALVASAATWERNVGVDRAYGVRNVHVGFGIRVAVPSGPTPSTFRVVALDAAGSYLELDPSADCKLTDVPPEQP